MFNRLIQCLVSVLAAFSLFFGTQVYALTVGAEQPQHYLPLIKDKRVGLVVNQTSMVGQTHLLDSLLAQNVNVKIVFAPEHGFRGDHDAGQYVKSSTDPKTGVPVYSIYGSKKTPDSSVLANLDVIVFDIQDVGTRFYTYLSSMHYMMHAAAEHDIHFLVLDRPNPNGKFVDGPVLKPQFSSFVGMHPIPILHGMTLGELALMIKGENWLDTQKEVDISVVPIANYTRDMAYTLPVKPSPNLPNAQSIQLYPTLCLFEPTVVSIGRGTDFPFQVIGYTQAPSNDFSFTPVSKPGASSNPKLKGVTLSGWNLQDADIEGLHIETLLTWYAFIDSRNTDFFSSASYFDKLAGTDALRQQIKSGFSAKQIKATWQRDLNVFKQQRQPYLLYPDIK